MKKNGEQMSGNLSERKILDATLNAVAKHSISRTRMHLIAEEANTATSNLHYYFKTKEDLLMALLTDLQETFDTKRNNYIAKSEDTLESRISSFFDQKKDLILNDPQYDKVQFDFWVLSQSDEDIHEMFLPSYTDWHDHIRSIIQEYCPDIEPAQLDMVPYIMISMMMGASMQYLNNTKAFKLDDYFDMCRSIILDLLHKLENKDGE